MIATYGYDIRGRRESLTRGNGTVATYQYDSASRLSQLSDLTGTAQAFTLEFRYNYAGQIVWSRRSNDLYSVAPAAGTVIENPNGLNQIDDRNGTTFVYDGNGNLLTDGTRTYLYAADNRLGQANGNWLGADPLGRLNHSWYNNDGFDYEGHNLIVHRSGSTGPAYERYVHGPGADEPLMAVNADGSNRRFLHADERGSIVAVSDSSGSVTAVNRYDEYGAPASGNTGFFQYAGQPWLAAYGAQVYYSRARMYDRRLGRFLQTDPIGYGDGMNLYAYVRGDPMNRRDPSGMCTLWSSNRWDVFNGHTGEYLTTEPGPTFYTVTNCEPGGGGSGRFASYFSAGDGGEGASGSDAPPSSAICPGNNMRVTRQGNSVRIAGNIQFRLGNPVDDPRTAPPAPFDVSNTYRNHIERFWTGQFGRYSTRTELTLGPGGITALIGNPGAGGAGVLGGDVMWLWPLHGPEWPPAYNGARGRLAAHEFGHNLGLPHGSGGLMDQLAGGPVLESHIAAVLTRCGLGH